MSRGGLYNKLGLYYEIEWTIRQILYIHSGKFDSIYLEHPSIDDKFEFELKSSDRIEYHQVKRQRDEGTWTFKKLEKYIKTFYEIYKQNKNAHFIFVSTTSATELWNLKDRIDSSDSFESFNQDKPKKMTKLINDIKKSLNQSDEEVYYFFQNLNFHSEDEKLMEESNCSYIKSNFKEDAKTVHNFLSSYIEENIGEKITRNQILSELNKFKPYHINPTDPDKIQEINKDFITKIKLKTATFTQRTEINKVKKAIKNKENIIILGDGGVGKSTFIRQIIEDINERTYFVLDLEGFDFNGKNNFHEALGLDNPIASSF